MTFTEHKYSGKQIAAFRANAAKDLKRALEYDDPDASFRFAYDALIKLAIAVSASSDRRVMSRAGHYAELIERLSDTLALGRIKIIGNEMRRVRNKDMYAGGAVISRKAAHEYAAFVKEVFALADDYFGKKEGRAKML